MSYVVFVTKIISATVIFLLAFKETLECTDRFLTGRGGVVSSYNFPLDYATGTTRNYTHRFYEFDDGEATEICFQFRRFHLSHSDYLWVNGQLFRDRGELSLANLCVPVTNNRFEMLFQSFRPPSGFRSSGFFAIYYVITGNPTVTTDLPFDMTSESNQTEENGNPGLTTNLPLDITTEGNRSNENVFCNSPDLFQCFDGKKCINSSLQCDGEFHCDDQSDEAYATARCEGAEGQKSVFQAVNISSLPLDLRTYGIKITKGNWIAESESTDRDYGPWRNHVSGYYLRTDFSRESTAEMEYELAQDTYHGSVPYCLTFWYNMNGKDSGQLNVLWRPGIYASHPIWTRVGNLYDVWHKAEVERERRFNNEKIIFEAIRGGEEKSQIAIQDISVMPGPCHCNVDYDVADDISCTFEEDMCHWKEETQWEKTSMTNNNGPDRAAQGYFYLKPKGSSASRTLTSPIITRRRNSCLVFKAFSAQYNLITASIYSAGSHKESSFFTYGSTDWKMFQLDISVMPIYDPYYITLTSESEGIFYDDFAYMNLPCSYLDIAKCETNEYMCGRNLECIRQSEVCNGEKDCEYGEDEYDCESCRSLAHHCDNDQCVPYGSDCDGEVQCDDQSDERNCNWCRNEGFLCNNGRCVPKGSKCDGISQCWDASDEHGCNQQSLSTSFETVIIATISVIVVLIVVGVTVSFVVRKSRKRQRPSTEITPQGGNQNVVQFTTQSSLEFAMQPPPEYMEAVNNPAYQPPHKASVQANDELHSDKDDLPSYDIVSSGNFVQLTVPVEEDVARMRQQMAPSTDVTQGDDTEAYTNSAYQSDYPIGTSTL